MRNSTTTDATPRPSPLLHRVLWFVGLWCGGVAAVGAYLGGLVATILDKKLSDDAARHAAPGNGGGDA